MIMIPCAAAAVAVSHAVAQTPPSRQAAGIVRVSRKLAQKYSRPVKSSYKIPKGEGKQAKYVTFLTRLLALDAGQQQQGGAIFKAAASIHKGLHGELKAARVSLRDAVRRNDSVAIDQVSTTIGRVTAQRTAVGASAHAAFSRLLTFEQQQKLTQSQA
jgi:hypothetical protein